MMEYYLIYLAKVALANGIMMIAWRFLLKNDNMLRFNRYYLLSAIILPWLFPVLVVKIPGGIQSTAASMPLLYTMTEVQSSQVIPESTGISVLSVVFILYAIVAACFMVSIVAGFIQVSRILKNSSPDSTGQIHFNHKRSDLLPFSFFRKVVMGSGFHSMSNLNLILAHEKVHGRQFHTADILLAAVMKAALWFSPFSWIQEKSIKSNLEYMADAEVLRKFPAERETYQHALVNIGSGRIATQIINGFNQTQLKSRIIMMKKSINPSKINLKALVALPLVALLFFSFCTKETLYDLSAENQTVSGVVTDAAGALLEGVQVFVNEGESGAVTDAYGKFRVKVSSPLDSLQFFVGDQVAAVVHPDGKQSVNVQLEPKIRVRGIGARSPIEPVYIVDGVRIETIDDLNPGEIESIQVLKGANAMEYLDEESDDPESAGVVLIITKAGAPDTNSEKKSNIPIIKNDSLRVVGYAEIRTVPDTVNTGVSRFFQNSLDDPIYYLDDVMMEERPLIVSSEIEYITVLKGEEAYKKIGTEEARQRGVIMITSKKED